MTHPHFKLGIIGALDLEVDTLKADLDQPRCFTKARMSFCEGSLDGHELVIAKCGVGKANAAACVQIMTDLCGATHIINTGIAGSLDADVHLGDLVISANAIYHDMDACVIGCERGQVPGLEVSAFEADESMRRLMHKAAACVMPEASIHEGRIVSGDLFVSSQSKKDELKSVFDALCCEMEGAAVAHMCYVNDLPFVIVRSISDGADDEANTTYNEFEEKSARRSAEVVRHFIRLYPNA